MSNEIEIAIKLGILPDPNLEYRETEKNRFGLVSYPHKTGSFVQIVSRESYDKNKKYYNARKGARSCMKQFM
jgi:hypothetical protein